MTAHAAQIALAPPPPASAAGQIDGEAAVGTTMTWGGSAAFARSSDGVGAGGVGSAVSTSIIADRSGTIITPVAVSSVTRSTLETPSTLQPVSAARFSY